MVWTAAGEGGTFRVAVPAGEADAFLAGRRAALAAERERLLEIGAAAVTLASGEILTELLLRVPAYVDWVYGWIDGYVAAFKVIARGTRGWLGAGAGAGGPRPAYRDAMVEVARAELEAIVVRPVDPVARMGAALDRLDAALADEWRRVLARDRGRWLGLLAAHAQGARRAEPSAAAVAGCAPAGPTAAAPPLDGAALTLAPALAQEELLVWRVTRPFAIRVAAVATRAAVGAASLSGGGVLGFGAAPTAGAAALSLAATSAAVWSLDYGLNQVDAALHRDRLAAEVSGALARTVADAQAALRGRLAQRVDRALADLAACPSAAAAPR